MQCGEPLGILVVDRTIETFGAYVVSAEWSINEREGETARCRFCCSAVHTPASLLPILSLDHQPLIAAGVFLQYVFQWLVFFTTAYRL